MAPSAIMPYDPEAGYNFKRLVGVDGEEGDRDVAVPEPEGWPKRMSPGQSEAHPRLQFGRETVARTKVRLLGHDLTLRIITSQRVQFNDRSIYLPPRGGAFVDFRFRPFDSDDAAGVGEALRQAAEAGTLRVRIDHEDRRSIRGALRIPESRGSGLRLKTFGPSALFVVSTLEGARFVISDGDREYVATQDGEVTRSDQDQQ